MAENNDHEDNIAIACIATTSIFGLISNGLALYMTRKMSCFRNAFGILCSSFLICNMQTILLFFTWTTTVLNVKNPSLSSAEFFLARIVGVFVNGGWFGSLFVHFFIALNRLCAIAYPMKYKKLWSEAKALAAGIFSWALGMTICMIHLFKDCSLLFDGKSYDFYYQNSFYGNICSNGDVGLTLITIIAVILLDVVTFIKILTHRRTVTGESAVASGARNKREFLFFKQSCLLGFTFAGNIVILAVHQFLFTNKWLLFASSTITFIMTLSMDGLLFLVFNLKMLWKTIWMVSVAPTTLLPASHATRF